MKLYLLYLDIDDAIVYKKKVKNMKMVIFNCIMLVQVFNGPHGRMVMILQIYANVHFLPSTVYNYFLQKLAF